MSTDNDKELNFNDLKKTFHIDIDGVDRTICFKFTPSYISILIDCQNNNYQNVNQILESIFKKMMNIDINDQFELSKDDIHRIIDLNLNQNEKLYSEWNKIDESDFSIRYVKAQLSLVKIQFKEALDTMQESISEMGKAISQLISASINNQNSSLKKLTKSIIDLSICATNKLKALNFSTISDEEKERLISNYTEYGKKGWTLIPNAPINYFNEISPNPEFDIDSKIMQYCNDEKMNNYFIDLSQDDCIDTLNLEEAIFCFNNGKYKACIMILFSMIDNTILSQLDDRRITNCRRPIGEKGYSQISEKIKNKEKRFLIEHLIDINLFECIRMYYENGGDFINQPINANRNFVMHGMLEREINRVDCTKVFFLYSNLVQFFKIENILVKH